MGSGRAVHGERQGEGQPDFNCMVPAQSLWLRKQGRLRHQPHSFGNLSLMAKISEMVGILDSSALPFGS